MSENSEQIREAVEYVTSLIQRDVRAGFDPVDSILENAIEAGGDGLPDPGVIRPVARRVLRDALASQYREQAGWPDKTDCDRLDEAFADLESRGVVSRQNFSCCGNCGCAEIGSEIAAAEGEGRVVRGYTFYHMQDTESAVEGGHLYLNYGATEDGEEAALAVAREIIAVLVSHGLTTDWNGSWRQRIGVTLDWKRRRPIEAGWETLRPRPGLFDGSE